MERKYPKADPELMDCMGTDQKLTWKDYKKDFIFGVCFVGFFWGIWLLKELL